MKTTLLLTAALCLLAPAVLSADKDAVEVDQARTTLKKWVETRRIMSQEKRDWALAREVLNGRIDLVQREIGAQRDKIGETEASIAAVHHQRAELIEENEQLKAAAEALSNTLVGLEARTSALLQRLPDALRAHVRPLSQRLPKSLPDHPKDTKLSLAERFQNVIGILNEVNKFNREITVSSEVLTLSDGASAEVTALYVGIGKAYYVSRNRSAAGIGTASPDGWVWQPANAAAEQIANAIAILKNERVASFVTLPIEIE